MTGSNATKSLEAVRELNASDVEHTDRRYSLADAELRAVQRAAVGGPQTIYRDSLGFLISSPGRITRHDVAPLATVIVESAR